MLIKSLTTFSLLTTKEVIDHSPRKSVRLLFLIFDVYSISQDLTQIHKQFSTLGISIQLANRSV